MGRVGFVEAGLGLVGPEMDAVARLMRMKICYHSPAAPTQQKNTQQHSRTFPPAQSLPLKHAPRKIACSVS